MPKAKAAAAPTAPAGSERLQTIVKAIEVHRANAQELESQLKETKAELLDLEENVLPEAMAAEDVEETGFTVPWAQGPVTLGVTYHANIKKDNAVGALQWLIATKRDHMIKRQFIVQFGLKEYEEATAFERMVRRLFPEKPVTLQWHGDTNPDSLFASLTHVIDESFSGHKLLVKDTVPGSTLKAFATVMLTKGKDWPADVFGAFKRRRAVLPWLKADPDEKDSAASVLED